jgi:hypothetical protein
MTGPPGKPNLGRGSVETARSKDGIVIACDRSGQGPPVVIVGGALQDRAAQAVAPVLREFFAS